jgi:hypothetical protein
VRTFLKKIRASKVKFKGLFGQKPLHLNLGTKKLDKLERGKKKQLTNHKSNTEDLIKHPNSYLQFATCFLAIGRSQ